MSFSSLLNTIDQYVKLPTWLQMVGTLVTCFMIGFMPGHLLGFKGLAYLGVGFWVAGRLYEEVYP